MTSSVMTWSELWVFQNFIFSHITGVYLMQQTAKLQLAAKLDVLVGIHYDFKQHLNI